MASRARKFCLELLEGRQLLSHLIALAAGEVSILARAKPKTMSIGGTIAGTYGVSASTIPETANFDGSGNLPVLGLVQMRTTIPELTSPTEHGTMTLTTSAGTLTFGVVQKSRSPLKLTLKHGTNAYAGWSGSGTLTVKLTESGYRHLFTDENTFKLKLKT